MIGFVKNGYPTNKRPGRSRASSNHPTVSADVKRHIYSDGRLEKDCTYLLPIHVNSMSPPQDIVSLGPSPPPVKRIGIGYNNMEDSVFFTFDGQLKCNSPSDLDVIDRVGFKDDMFFEISFGSHGDEIQVHGQSTCLFDSRAYLRVREQHFHKTLQQYPTLLAPSSLPQTVGQYLQHQGHFWAYSKSGIKGVAKVAHGKLRQRLRRALLAGNFIRAGRILRHLRPRIPEYARIQRLKDVLKLMHSVERSLSTTQTPGVGTGNARPNIVSSLRRHLKKHVATGVEMVGKDGSLHQIATQAATMDAVLGFSGKETKFAYVGTSAKALIVSEILKELSTALSDEPCSLDKLLAYSQVLRGELSHLGVNPFTSVISGGGASHPH